MSTEMDTTQKLVSAFNRQKCWMITPLAEQINYSIPSIRDGKDFGEIEQLSVISAYSLVLWCLNGKKSGNVFGFPFDRPLLEFAQRQVILNDYLPEVQQWLPDNDLIGNRGYRHKPGHPE